ncbi:MAG: chaperone NapD [Gammaproteobacteria bacterium]|nr:chaperone NapD [Gammaproteobacteria bacterium]
MYIIGLFVIVDPDSIDLVVPEINSFCDVEIKLQNRESGTLVLAITNGDERYNKSLFDRIKALPFVMDAEIMYFYRYNTDVETDFAGSKRAQRTRSDLMSKALQTYSSYNSIIHTRH